MKRLRHIVFLFVLFSGAGLSAFGQTETSAPKIDTGDTAWMLVSAALVLFMTIPGLFLFYGGLVRSKNVLGMLMQNFSMVAIVTIQWIVIGYTLAFAGGTSFLGGFQWTGLSGVGLTPNPDYAATIPHQTLCFISSCLQLLLPP